MEQVLEKHPPTLKEQQCVTTENQGMALEQGALNGIHIISEYSANNQVSRTITKIARYLLLLNVFVVLELFKRHQELLSRKSNPHKSEMLEFSPAYNI